MSNRCRPRTNAFVYVYRGELTLDHTVVRCEQQELIQAMQDFQARTLA